MSNIFNRMLALREERLRNPHGTAIRMAIQAARINGQTDEYIKENVLAPMVGTIPAGTYLLVEQDYDSEDAADLVAGFMTELSPTNLNELSETIDVDRK